MKLILAKVEKHATPIMLVLFGLAAVEQLHQSLHWGHNSWQMTEWLINYSGGFVRRGLPGQLIYQISATTNIPANLIAIAASVIAFIALMGFFFHRSAGRISILTICSPVLLGPAAYEAYIVRKDALGIVLLILCLLVDKTKTGYWARSVLVNAVGVLATLSHEAFFFFGLPAIVICRYLDSRNSLIRSAASFAPMICAFALACVFRGNATTADAINASLYDLWQSINPGGCCFHAPSGAIDALGWTPEKAMSLSYGVLAEFSFGIYSPLAWLCSMAICLIYLIALLEKSPDFPHANTPGVDEERSRLFVILVFQLVAVAPLFVLGSDFGRWIFLWTSSAVAIYLVGVNWSAAHAALALAKASKFLEGRSLPWQPRPWHLLFFGVPGCCWSIFAFAASSPAGSLSANLSPYVWKLIGLPEMP